MEQLTLQDHPQVLVIDENTDNGWEGGREKDKKMECMHCCSIMQEL